MPVPAQLKIGKIELDLDVVRLNFLIYKTTCDVPSCEALADNYYQTTWSFIWICAEHYKFVNSLGLSEKATWDLNLAIAMYDRMLVFNFIHQNIESNFELQRLINERKSALKELGKLEARRRAKEQQEIRRHIRAADVRVGMPDDELLTARHRQIQRKQAGSKPLGKPVTDRSALLKPKLLVTNTALVTETSPES